MASILGLSGSVVGVRLLASPEALVKVQRLEQHRYCQALMRARRGQPVILDKDGIARPAAAFGSHPLPEGLRSGKGLVGFGIVSDEAVGRRMFEAMPKLEPGQIRQLHLFPLDQAEFVPDVVVVEDEVEKLMWVNLAYLHTMGGERVQSSIVILQATCVGSTIVPYLENRLNFGYKCYGGRDATDLGQNETVVGFPAGMLPPMMDALDYLAHKAIPASRAKKAWGALHRHGADLEHAGWRRQRILRRAGGAQQCLSNRDVQPAGLHFPGGGARLVRRAGDSGQHWHVGHCQERVDLFGHPAGGRHHHALYADR